MFAVGSRVAPIKKSVSVAAWVTAHHCNKCEAEEHQQEDHFAQAEQQPRFAVPLNSGHVDDAVDGNARQRVGPEGYVVSPKSKNQSNGRYLEWNKDGLEEKEVPTAGKSKGLIGPFSGESNEGCRNRHVDCHLSDTVVDRGDNTTMEDEG